MVVLGLILLVLSGVFIMGVVLSNTDTTAAEAFGVSLSNVTLGGLFLAGAVAGLVFMLGLALLTAGASRARRRKVETKRAVKGVRSEKEQLEEENTELKAALADSSPPPHVSESEGRHAAERYDSAGRSTYPSDSDTYVKSDERKTRTGLFGRH